MPSATVSTTTSSTTSPISRVSAVEMSQSHLTIRPAKGDSSSDQVDQSAASGMERCIHAGEVALNLCFLANACESPANERPPGHFGTMQGQVLAKRTYKLLVAQSTLGLGEDVPQGVAVDLLYIIAGCVFRFLGLPQRLSWFASIFGPLISAADLVYVKHHATRFSSGFDLGTSPGQDRDENRPPSKQFSQVRTFFQQLTLESTICSTSEDAPVEAVAPVKAVAPVETPTPVETATPVEAVALVDPLATEAEADARQDNPWLQVAARVFACISREKDAFFATAFPHDVLALAREIPVAFITGLRSAFTPTQVERRAASADRSSKDSTSSSRLAKPPSLKITSQRTKTRTKPYERARAPSPPSPERRHRSTHCPQPSPLPQQLRIHPSNGALFYPSHTSPF
ncbi:hypothetical protein DFH06DRAFT_1366809 [Mycena polygramma]|nr:hypothetical protein DFH06DRAFT_1366809 [Mycena polygramma]